MNQDNFMGNKKGTGRKIITGLFFLASLFLAAAVLVGSVGRSDTFLMVAIAGVLMLVAGYFFLSAVFEGKEEEWSRLYEEMEKESHGGDTTEQMVNYMESVERTQKAVFSVMKRREESTEAQMTRLENAIERMAEQRAADHKALVRYNKENARQMAINERETLEHAMSVIVKKMEEGKTQELEALRELLEKGTSVVKEETVNASEPMEEEFVPEFILPETETVTAEPEDISADAFGAATGVDLSDPNAALSPEDIAKLFAAAGN